MRVLLISQYFHPEMTAAALRLRPLGAGLVERGHHVEVVCEIPSHPGGVVDPAYRGGPVLRRELDGMLVDYVWAYASTSKRASARLAAYATYAAASTVAGGLRRRPDVVVASSPPLSVGAVGVVLSKRFRVPWILDVRDLWPEVATALGELPDRRVARLAAWLERRLYRSAAAITAATASFVDHIARFTDRSRITLLPNGTTRAWLDLGDADVERREVGIPNDRFVWTYAGNVGLSQGLEAAVAAADLLGDGFQLLILGDGSSRRRLRERASAVPDGRVTFRDAVPAELAARYMRASDALLVPLADHPALGKTIPIKLYDSCAVGRPVLVAAPGEARRLAEEEGAGIPVPPGDPEALAEAIRKLASDDRLRASTAERARRFAAGHLRDAQVPRLEEVLREVTRRRTGRATA
jgi:glycosyltransferase involved in cell wall biosynthesis